MVPLNLSLDWQATELLWDLKRYSLFSLRRKGFSLNHTHNVGFKKSDDPQQTRRNEGKYFSTNCHFTLDILGEDLLQN